jgi:hypothetical protein
MNRLCKLSGLLCVSVVLWGCPPKVAIWLAPGSTVDELILLLGENLGKQERVWTGIVRIDSCESVSSGTYPPWEDASWALANQGSAEVSRINYGTAPDGFDQNHPADQLDKPGCYLVSTSGMGTRLEIDEDGRVSESSGE